jgi:hypothetical protein
VAIKILELIEDELDEIKVEVLVLMGAKHPALPAFYGALVTFASFIPSCKGVFFLQKKQEQPFMYS